jgi:hypothetical protein
VLEYVREKTVSVRSFPTTKDATEWVWVEEWKRVLVEVVNLFIKAISLTMKGENLYHE